MERNRLHEVMLSLRKPAVIIALGLGGTAMLSSCASGDTPPSSKETFDPSTVQIFEYPNVTDGTGDALKCLVDKGSGDNGAHRGWAWEAMSCDFSGEAIFPGETSEDTN